MLRVVRKSSRVALSPSAVATCKCTKSELLKKNAPSSMCVCVCTEEGIRFSRIDDIVAASTPRLLGQ